MDKNEFKDRLFDAINDSDNTGTGRITGLPIQDIVVEDANDSMNIYLTDGSRFTIRVESCGNWGLYKV